MELGTIVLIYLAVAVLLSIALTTYCVVLDEYVSGDEIIGITFISMTWPVTIIPFVVMELHKRKGS